jgi:hypothetical protein
MVHLQTKGRGVSFINLFVNWTINRLLPQIRQFFLIPTESELMSLWITEIFHFLLELILLEFDHNLEIYTSSMLQQQFQPQDNWDQVLVAQL